MPSPRDARPGAPDADVATVDAFFEALSRGDLDTARALLAPDVVWLNTGLPTLRGRRAHQALSGIDRAGVSFAAVTHHRAVAEAGVVLTDRTDMLRIGPVRTAFPVRGTLEVRDGRIAVWDDQFSLRQFLVGFLRPLPGPVAEIAASHG